MLAKRATRCSRNSASVLAHLNVLIATVAIVTLYVINVKRDYRRPDPPAHKWVFAARFRRRAFGWRSQPAVQRVREATAEIREVAKKDPALAAAGEVLFLKKVSPALEHVDSSSGAIGTAVNHAIEVCAKIIAEAPVDDETRDRWLDRLWEAHQNDEIPYIERLTDYWGELCASRDRASAWADRLIDTVETV